LLLDLAGAVTLGSKFHRTHDHILLSHVQHGRERLTLNISLKREEDIEAAVQFSNDTVQWASRYATPEHTDTLKRYDCHTLMKQQIEKKRNTPYGLAPITNTKMKKKIT
jgi:hypothetical protein